MNVFFILNQWLILKDKREKRVTTNNLTNGVCVKADRRIGNGRDCIKTDIAKSFKGCQVLDSHDHPHRKKRKLRRIQTSTMNWTLLLHLVFMKSINSWTFVAIFALQILYIAGLTALRRKSIFIELDLKQAEFCYFRYAGNIFQHFWESN